MQLSDKTIDELASELSQIPLFEDLHPRTLLKRIPFFHEITEELLDKIGSSAIIRTFKAGDIVCNQGEYGDSFFIILKGAVEVSIQTQENPHIPLATLSRNDFFGEASPLTGNPRTATITALEHTILLELTKDAFMLLFKKAPAFKKKIDEVYLERVLSTHLRRVSLFADLPDEVIEKIKQKVTMLEFERGDPILKMGEPGDSLYFIRSGFVKVSIGSGEDEKVLAYLKDGSYFGEMSLLTGGVRTANVSAVTHVDIIKLNASDFREILSGFPDVFAKLDETVKAREARTKEITQDENKAQAMKFVVNIGMAQAAKVLIIELDKCIRCNCCVLACAYTHEGYPRIERRGHRHKNILLPTTCMHCTDPECMLCPYGGIYRDKDGEIHHTVQCINCGACAKRCPYGNILVVEPEVEDKLYKGISDKLRTKLERRKEEQQLTKKQTRKRVVKCDMCAGREVIACVYNCPVNACRVITPEEFIELSSNK